MQVKFDALMMRLDGLCAKTESISPSTTSLCSCSGVNVKSVISDVTGVSSSTYGNWANVAKLPEATGFKHVFIAPARKTVMRVKGTKKSAVDVAHDIKCVPRKKVVAACVSRIDNSVTEEAFKEYLSQFPLRDIVCRKIKPKDGKEYKSSMFFVSCDVECAGVFFDENTWPESAEVRDWVFRS
jgi:hypothetical protein